jgi:hypothetical protein
MKLARQNAKLASVFLTIVMLSITIPYQSIFAAMIGTEAALDSTQAQQARADINNLLLRADVRSALMAQGINPIEAKARIDSLSDAEVTRIADRIDKQLPAGGMGSITPPLLPIIIGLIVVVLVIYLVISGITPPTEVEKKSE